ncbi:alpha/beta hydrolase [Ferruginibacter paludis]|uniref:alpha/beta fold hydrolase n=1 Tax=Ferruginibacter paludis TaxID=1310417 RepID=UPI0025B59D6B|nr:alpha/beta hydrolase [Ferruginibacter paludis]MDN3656201.1 alpha/beta hydrolase [Ferruginibacter paludis]
MKVQDTNLTVDRSHQFKTLMAGNFRLYQFNKTTMTVQTNHHIETKPEATSGYAAVNGLKMYFEIHGAGTPLVLIHGGGSTIHTTFGRVLQALAKSHQVIAVEMQAHGHTADIDRPLSFQQDADDIAALLKQLRIGKADIFGFSNGASTTLEFAIRHPEMTNKIIVASIFYNKAGAPDWFWPMMSKPTFEDMPQPYKDAFLKINPDTNALHRMYERDVARMLAFPDISDDDIKSIKAPALIIAGDRDVVTPEHAVQMHSYISNSRLAIFPGGHGDYIGELTTPQNNTLIAATISMINQFLDGPEVKDAGYMEV